MNPMMTSTTFTIEGFRTTRYDATEIAQGISEVLCYGTAVVMEPDK